MNAPPPHDIQSELAVLGCLLLARNPDEAKSILDVVAPSDFYRSEHRDVLIAEMDLWETKAACDPLLLRTQLQETGTLERVGGSRFIESICATPPVLANAVLYAQTVRGLSKKRAAIQAAEDLVAIVSNGNDPSQLARAKERLEWAEAGVEPDLDPIPITDFGVPQFPHNAFYYRLWDWIEDIAKGAQVAPDMPGTILLSVLSTCLAKKFEIRVGGRWVEALNIWTMVTASSGERKTPIITEAKAPLVDYEMQRQMDERQDLIRQRATMKAAEGRLAAVTKSLSKNPTDKEIIKAHEEAIQNLADTPEPKHAFRLLGDDTTPESLVAMMAHQGERLALFSSEGGMLKTVMGAQYSAHGAANRDVLLKTYSGESITQDRKNSASNSLRHPALTLGLFVQPAVLDKLIRDPDNTDLGLLARFLLCNCPSKIGFRNVELVEPDWTISAEYKANIRALLDLPVPEKPEPIPLSPDALTALNAFREEIETRMRPDGDLYNFRDFGAKLPGQVVRIAGNLGIAESIISQNGVPKSIPPEAIERGILLGRYYLAHTMRAVGTSGQDPDIETAKRILDWIARHPATSYLTRDIFQGLKGPRSTVKTMEHLRRPIRFLINSRWLVGDRSPNDPPKRVHIPPNAQKALKMGDLGDHPL